MAIAILLLSGHAAVSSGDHPLYGRLVLDVEFPEGDVHGFVLKVRTEDARCVTAFVRANNSGEAPYLAGFSYLAIADRTFSGLPAPDPSGTPLESERYLLQARVAFKAQHDRSDAHRDHVDIAGVGWSRTEGMDETRDPTRGQPESGQNLNHCWGVRQAPSELQKVPEEWYVYVSNSHPLERIRVYVREWSDTIGDARVLGHAYATTSTLHVSQPYEWDATVDRQSKDGSATLSAGRDVDVEHGFVGVLWTPGLSATRYETPQGRIGSDLDGCFRVAENWCYFATGRVDHFFVHGNEPGRWRFDIEAMQSLGHTQAALMWLDVPEPEV